MCNSYLSHDTDDDADEMEGNGVGVLPAKRLRVSDIDISRYEEEFVEIKDIASGSFGKVKVARHCLDGMVYAIKVKINNDLCLKMLQVLRNENASLKSPLYYGTVDFGIQTYIVLVFYIVAQ